MSFSWCCTSFWISRLNCPFFEHCIYYSEKATARQEKFSQRILILSAFFHISTGKAVEKYFPKRIFWDFLRLDLLYIVVETTKSPMIARQKIFSATFLLNLWITFDILMTAMSFPPFHRIHKGKYYVIHKLLINLLITFQSCENRCWNRIIQTCLEASHSKALLYVGILWKRTMENLCITEKTILFPAVLHSVIPYRCG